MKVLLKTLIINNFKGIHNQEIAFSHITNIFGDNATGKTTILDAFLWLFFGKNSEDVSKFEIKRLDANNKFIKDLEAEVSAIFEVEGAEIAAKKVLRQKWVKRRGELEAAYQGDENIYYWNDVPCSETEFRVKIKALLDENVFKLITNPFYFNSLKWNDRRNTLIEVAGNIKNEEVLSSIVNDKNKTQFAALVAALKQDKSIDEFKRELAAKKKKIKDEAESIPSRIDEVRRLMPDELNFQALRAEKEMLASEEETIAKKANDTSLQYKQANDARSKELEAHSRRVHEHNQSVFGLKNTISEIESEVKLKAKQSGNDLSAQIKSVTSRLADVESDRGRFANSVASFRTELTNKQTDLEKTYADYDELEAKVFSFDEHLAICPTCKQELPAENIASKRDELEANFNKDKRTKIEATIAKGQAIKAEIEAIEKRITNGELTISITDAEIENLHKKKAELQEQTLTPGEDETTVVARLLDEHETYSRLVFELAELQKKTFEAPVFEDAPTDNAANDKLKEIRLKIAELNKQLDTEEQIKRANKRIEELQTQESTLAQQLADFEGSEYAIMQFTKAKVDVIEQRINGKFKTVKFKMFNLQNNGGESECCETLINGVPFTDANNAAKINAGIDIINTLCQHYDVYAPIFIDNRESVTKLIESDSQIVNLIVSAADKKLRVA